jgi:ABC-type glutathione transport system ATPase component
VLERIPRVKQLSGRFDVPAQEKLSRHWEGDMPIDERDWNVGLIVGPSGAGKSSIKRQLFGEDRASTWQAKSVIDDFDERFTIAEVAQIGSAVGFNTIPAWMKPYAVLSTGEKFRIELARHLLEGADLVVVDEFTSVIDREVAAIGSHTVQKLVRKSGKRFVAVTCHYDVIDWLCFQERCVVELARGLGGNRLEQFAVVHPVEHVDRCLLHDSAAAELR